MASIQSKMTNGHKYWYIVESRRVNGKPRPIVLEYLGTAESLLERLSGAQEFSDYKLKSYSHGHVAALLTICDKLGICSAINRQTTSTKRYMAMKPIQNHLTVGGTLLLAAISRACKPKSKRGFYEWAKTTSLEYLTSTSMCKTDSQHFWNMMDCLPITGIAAAEEEIIANVSREFGIDGEKILYDATNYFTYIDTCNERSTLARRGKNKQKRNDLRQVGIALMVTAVDRIPIMHQTYRGNMGDSDSFSNILTAVKARMSALGLSDPKQTIVFDRGNNSKDNLNAVLAAGMHFVGALVPYQNKTLVDEASIKLVSLDDGSGSHFFRKRLVVLGIDMTAVVVISDKLKAGLVRELYAGVVASDSKIAALNTAIAAKRARRRSEAAVIESVNKILSKYKTASHIGFRIVSSDSGNPSINHWINYASLATAEDALGFCIIVTTQHDWESKDIVAAYHGQAYIENAFKQMKDPYHLSVRPQFHWTDQKVHVHNFCIVLAYLMNALLLKHVKDKCEFDGAMGSLLTKLDDVRLGSVIKQTGKKGRPAVEYSIESMDDETTRIVEAFGIEDLHLKRPKLAGFNTY